MKALISLFALVLLALATLSPAQAQAEDTWISIELGKSAVREFPGRVTAIAITDPKVARVQQLASASRYQIQGVSVGSTDLIVTMEGSTKTLTYEITVHRDLTDLIRRAPGGIDQGLEATGNVYFVERRIQDRFDSIGADLEIIGPEAAGPDDCALEPQGWIAIRDEDAYWYDLVFSPRFDGDPNDPDYPNEPYSECDGCGTLYVRGLEQDGIEVCLNLDFLWDGMLAPPELQEFAFTLRDPGEAHSEHPSHLWRP